MQMIIKLFLQICLHLQGTRRRVALVLLKITNTDDICNRLLQVSFLSFSFSLISIEVKLLKGFFLRNNYNKIVILKKSSELL